MQPLIHYIPHSLVVVAGFILGKIGWPRLQDYLKEQKAQREAFFARLVHLEQMIETQTTNHLTHVEANTLKMLDKQDETNGILRELLGTQKVLNELIIKKL